MVKKVTSNLWNNLSKKCIISIKNTDILCLVRAIVTAVAIQELEKYTPSQLNDGIKKSQKSQEKFALKLHVEMSAEINDWGIAFLMLTFL